MDKDKKQKIKDVAKVSIGAPLAALGGWAAFRGAPILKSKIKNISDGEFVSNYLKFSDNMLNKSYAGKKAINHHKNILKGTPEKSTKAEKGFANTMLAPDPKNDNFASKHYVGFSQGPKKSLDFWKGELKWHKAQKRTAGKTDPKSVKIQKTKEKNFEKDWKVLDDELSKAPDIHTGLKNAKDPTSQKVLKLLRAEKKKPGEIVYPAMIGGASAVGLVGAGLTADGLRKKASKEDKPKEKKEKKKKSAKEVIKEHSNVAGPAAASVGLAATPALRDKYLKGYEAKIDPKSKKLVIVTEGGKHNPGGGGHAAAARAISEEYDKIHGKGSSKVVNFTDYSKVRNKTLSKFNKNRYNGMTNPEYSKLRRGLNMAGYIAGFGPMRNTDKKRLQKDLQGAGRVITTQPDAVNFVRPVGVVPEVAVTDYGVGKGKAREFWRMAYGIGKKDKDKDRGAISKAYTPSEGAKKVFSEMGTPTKDIPSVPISSKFTESKKGKKSKLKEITLADNEGNPTGEKVKIDPNKKLVVVTGGTTGYDVDSITQQISKAKRKDLQIVGVSGKNKKVRKNMGKGVVAQGYEKNFDKLLDSADLVVARPHGISTTEALSKGKPVIPVTTHAKKDSYAPHMKGNAKNFSKMQGGSPTGVIKEKGSIEKAVNEVVDNLDKYKEKAQSASKDIKRNAAKIIAEDASTTMNKAYKMPNHLKGPLYLASAGAGAIALRNQLKKNKSKKERS